MCVCVCVCTCACVRARECMCMFIRIYLHVLEHQDHGWYLSHYISTVLLCCLCVLRMYCVYCVYCVHRYNNKTYRIDDIDWRKNPTATFETRKGTTSFIDYYRDAYNIDIKDREQPLLVSMPKKRVSVCVYLCVCACV